LKKIVFDAQQYLWFIFTQMNLLKINLPLKTVRRFAWYYVRLPTRAGEVRDAEHRGSGPRTGGP
jgi:hypothetical protein